jgi:Flp pilus assembly protein CpaB
VSRRRRALAFGLAAAFAAAGAAAVADGYGDSIARGYGALRPVVITSVRLPAHEPINPETVAENLELRRVPLRFVPPGALEDPTQALGLEPVAPVAAGSYLLASQLRSPRADDGTGGSLGRGRRPVEIAVSGADALLLAGGDPTGMKVDVVITTEPSSSSTGRTYIAAAAVPLLALGPGAEGEAPGGSAAATLGLTRAQALRLIDAESFARRITVLPAG